jgi:hypothetical protein
MRMNKKLTLGDGYIVIKNVADLNGKKKTLGKIHCGGGNLVVGKN